MSVRYHRVRNESLGDVLYVDVFIDDERIVLRAYLWKCPACGAVFKSLSLKQLITNVEAHKRKHVDIGGEVNE